MGFQTGLNNKDTTVVQQCTGITGAVHCHMRVCSATTFKADTLNVFSSDGMNKRPIVLPSLLI